MSITLLRKPILTKERVSLSVNKRETLSKIIKDNWATVIEIHQLYCNEYAPGKYSVKFFYEDKETGYLDWEAVTVEEEVNP
jgi:hypothetical protein